VKVGILQNELPDISAAHSHLQATISLLLAEREQGNPRSIRMAQDILRQERQAVDKEIRKLTAALQTLAKDSAHRARALEQRAIQVNWGITTGASILGLIFAALITRTLVKPVKQLLQGTRAVEQGDLSVHIHITSTDEIAVLAKSFNHMVAELKQKELIKETFGKYVDPRIVKSLLEDQRLSPGGERRLMTVFFSDLEDFTGLGGGSRRTAS
jgi:nitrogen fixation/metabolism regulation signal transduction histidine kinase